MRKLILYLSMSLDGYIAKKDDDLSFLSRVQQEREDYGYKKFMETIDTVIMGRRTYDWVMQEVEEFPHADKVSYVITRRKQDAIGNLRFYTGNLKALVLKLKDENSGKHIFCDGGAEIVNILLKERLFDELIISVVPVLLGDGIRLFKEASRRGVETTKSGVFFFGIGSITLRFLLNRTVY